MDSDAANTYRAAAQRPFAAIILAGGTGARLGGADKAALRVGEDTLLTRAIGAVRGATQIVVVGPMAPVPADGPPITFTRERPPGGGPAAGLLAGRDALAPDARLAIVLAVDMPGVTGATIARLATHVTEDLDGVFLAGPDGRRQLVGLVRLAALDGVRPGPEHVTGLPMHRLLDPLRLVLVSGEQHEGSDIDHWADLERWTRREQERQGLPTVANPVHAGPVNLHDWIDELCDVLDIETEVDEALILDLARAAAHNVERPAAPITTYLLGFAAAQKNANPERIERLAAVAQALAEGWDRPAGAPDPIDVTVEVPDDHDVDHTGDRFDL